VLIQTDRLPFREGAAKEPERLRSRGEGAADFVREWISWGAGLRASQFLVLGAKVRALLRGRPHVTPEDLQALAHPTLRHRILLNYRAEAQGISVGNVIARLLEAVPPAGGKV
jgi:MoxR-like ATPase